MAKKTKPAAPQNRKSIEKRRNDFKNTTIVTAIAGSLVIFYICLMYSAYQADHPRAQFTEIFTELPSIMAENPLYFWPITYDFSIAFGIVIIFVLLKFAQYSINKLRIKDREETIKGSTEWGDIKERLAKYADYEGKEYKHVYTNVILSQHLQMSTNQRKHRSTLNTLILGTTGSGKSRFFLKPNLLQMNCSYVITDPSGGILMENGETLRRFGYNIRVFDLVQMGNCNTYNPLKYCYKESDIKKLVQAFIKNTDTTGGKGGGNKDPFWDDSMNAFLCACIGLLVTKPSGMSCTYAQIPEITGGMCYEACFSNLTELTRMANSKWTQDCGIKLYNNVKLGDGKNNTANASKLAAIFENLRAWEAERQGLVSEDIEKMQKPYCLREWENFRIAPEKTSTTILMTTAVRLDAFNIEQVKNLTSTDTINLDTFANQRDALFLIIPTNDRTYNFLVSFIYTQLFDILYTKGEVEIPGSKDFKLASGELVRHFSREEVEAGTADEAVAKMRAAKIKYRGSKDTIKKGHVKETKPILWGLLGYKTINKTIVFDDSWWDILDKDGALISRRPTEALAKEYVKSLQTATLLNAHQPALPCHVRFLMDEFPNIGEVPEFKEKLATIRKYEISCTVICQTITQLKGMYPDDYEVIDANCTSFIFLGGTENSNNEYVAKKMGDATVKGGSISLDNGKSGKGNSSVQTDARQLMKPEELGRMPSSDEIVIQTGEQPIYDQKFDYPKHKNYKYTHDYCEEIGIKDGALFDRSVFKTDMVVQTIHPADMADSLPVIKQLTIDTLLSSVYTGDVDEALKRFGNGAAEAAGVDLGEEAIEKIIHPVEEVNTFEDMDEDTETSVDTSTESGSKIDGIFKKDNIPDSLRKKTGKTLSFRHKDPVDIANGEEDEQNPVVETITPVKPAKSEPAKAAVGDDNDGEINVDQIGLSLDPNAITKKSSSIKF